MLYTSIHKCTDCSANNFCHLNGHCFGKFQHNSPCQDHLAHLETRTNFQWVSLMFPKSIALVSPRQLRQSKSCHPLKLIENKTTKFDAWPQRHHIMCLKVFYKIDAFNSVHSKYFSIKQLTLKRAVKKWYPFSLVQLVLALVSLTKKNFANRF